MKIANFPNPALRPSSEPAELVSPHTIVALYNIAHALKVGSIDNNVKAWFKAEAKEVGWKCVEFFQDQAVLSVVDWRKIPYTVSHDENLWEYIGDLSQDLLECSYNEKDIREMWANGQLDERVRQCLKEYPDRLGHWRCVGDGYQDVMTALVKKHGGWAPNYDQTVTPLTSREQVVVFAFDQKYQLLQTKPPCT